MDACVRYEAEALIAIERGEPLDAHFASCAACLARAHELEELRRDLVAAGREPALGPVDDFQARVFARIASSRPSKRRLGFWLAPALVAAAVWVWVVWPQSPLPPQGPALAWSIVASSRAIATRGDAAQPGDTVVVRARLDGNEPAELRVYGDDGTLLLACAQAPPCRRSAGSLEASVVLAKRGDYDVLLLTGIEPPPGSGALDVDLAAAEQAGARVVRAAPILVR